MAAGRAIGSGRLFRSDRGGSECQHDDKARDVRGVTEEPSLRARLVF